MHAMDLTMILILLTGFGLGLGHSLDPDHVVAVSTLLCNNTSLRKSITSATAWGVGHSSVLFTVGICVLILRVAIPETVVNLFEFAAGVLLIVLGALVLRPLIAEKIRTPQKIGLEIPSHLTDSNLGHTHTHLHKSAVAGVLQGLGGSAALMLVTLTTVSTVEVGLVFILLLGVGVILGMVGIACLVGSLVAYTATNLEKIHKLIKAITGSASVTFGFIIIMRALV